MFELRKLKALSAILLVATVGLGATACPALADDSVATKDAGVSFDDDFGSSVAGDETGADETDPDADSWLVYQDPTYSHSDVVEQNGVTLTVYWTEPTKGQTVYFHAVVTGASSSAKVSMVAQTAGATAQSKKNVALTDNEADFTYAPVTYDDTVSFYLTDSTKSISNLTLTINATCTITSLNSTKTTISVKDQLYNDGKSLQPSPIVKYNGVKLTEGTDYTIGYENNIDPGTATITITGTGAYKDSKKTTFKITGKIADTTIQVASQTYDGSSSYKPVPTVDFHGTTLKLGTDYTISGYSNYTKVGTASVTIEGTGYYTGSKTAKFSIINGSISRLWGDTRYDTMSKVVGATTASADTVIIASGENFPDALGASALAGACNAPILLTQCDALSEQTRSAITRLKAATAYIVGGESAVSSAVESAVKNMGLTVQRVAGQTREDTAVQIAQQVASMVTSNTIIVASGANYPDALSISPYAYAKCAPIFLTDSDGSLSDETLAAITSQPGANRVIIVGGTAAVSNKALAALKSAKFSVERWSGDTRYDTSLAIAENAVADGLKWSTVGVASGENFPDALSAASLIGKANGVLLLTQSHTSSAIDSTLAVHSSTITNLYLIGGTSAVSTQAETELRSALGWKPLRN